MQASQTKLRQLIEGTKQYVVPLFQRPYSWSERQWKMLWSDIREKAQHSDARPHFFGSIVTTPAKTVPEGVGKFLLVDGQQRLTTIQIMLAALRDVAKETGNTRLSDRIQGEYLENKYETEFERLKVLPTQDDRDSFRAIIENRDIPDDRLGQCYQFFRTCLLRISEADLDSYHLATVDRLTMVSITCDDQDNPQLIFESLNAKGEKLTPADLIRNFLLMKIHVNEQERVFLKYWLPIQQTLGSELTEFVRHFLMKEGKILKNEEVYFELKDRLANSNSTEAESFLEDLNRHGLIYHKFIHPQSESDIELSHRLEPFKRLKVTVVYPLLLRLFDALESGRLTRLQIIECLWILESFIIRRSVCKKPSNELRRIFPPVFEAAGGAGPNFVEAFRKQLGGNRCPDDETFNKALLSEPLYGSTDKNTRLRLMLERLERSYGHKEPADFSNATIEHVLPQSPTTEWLEQLGEEAATNWIKLVHAFGNLTLTAYNSELSNQPYAAKKLALMQSNFVLNHLFRDYSVWNEQNIQERGRILVSQALQVWPDVGRLPGVIKGENPIDGKPTRIRLKQISQPCSNWREGFVKIIQLIENDKPGILERLADDESFIGFISKDPFRFVRARTQIGEIFVNTHASASQLRDWLRRVAEKASYSAEEYGYLFEDAKTQS